MWKTILHIKESIVALLSRPRGGGRIERPNITSPVIVNIKHTPCRWKIHAARQVEEY